MSRQRLSNVGGRHGAPMGRASYEPSGPGAVAPAFTITRVSIDSQGYDAGGAYWGTGQPLYRAECDDAAQFLRADTVEAARAELLAEYPGATFPAPAPDLDDASDTLDVFCAGFFEAIIFSENCPQVYWSEWNDSEIQDAIREGTQDGTIPDDSDVSEFDAESLKSAKAFCAEFVGRAADALARAYAAGYSEDQAGRDLYFSYVGHGVGYWSRDELSGGLGAELTELAGRGEINADAQLSDDDTRELNLYIG